MKRDALVICLCIARVSIVIVQPYKVSTILILELVYLVILVMIETRKF